MTEEIQGKSVPSSPVEASKNAQGYASSIYFDCAGILGKKNSKSLSFENKSDHPPLDIFDRDWIVNNSRLENRDSRLMIKRVMPNSSNGGSIRCYKKMATYHFYDISHVMKTVSSYNPHFVTKEEMVSEEELYELMGEIRASNEYGAMVKNNTTKQK